MKKLSPIVAAAACATSTVASTAASTTTTTTTVLPTTTTTTKRIPWVVNNFPRGGDEENDDSINEGDNKKNNSSNKSKKSSRSGKKKKSTKTKQEEKAQTKNKTNNSNPILEEILQHEDFYDVLGVPNTASERDIQKAYRKRCVQTHPDKTGGDRRAFDKVAEAYDVLSDQSKRQVYNRFGKAGMDPTNNGSNGANPFGGGGDGAAAMFRDMFQQARQQQQRRNQTLRYQLEVTLEDLYFGSTRSVQVTPPRNSSNYQQQRRRKEVDVHISKGSVNGQSVVLSGEVDFNDDNSPPGDLVFILTQVPHATFTRKGHDLAMELNISLEEALCGLKRSIKHLDGTEMWIESANYSDDENGKNKGKINKDKYKADDLVHNHDDDENSNRSSSIPITIRTGDVQVLKGRGMPKRNTNDEFGDLYIQYRVEMPKSKSGKALTEEEYMELSRLLTKLDENRGGNNRRNRQSMSRRHNKDEQQQQAEIKPKMYSLKEAKPSDFGTASGKVVWEDEDGMGGGGSSHDNHGDEFHQFGSSFFQRGSSASGSPFGGMGGFNPDDGNVQCQQM
jgi:DnaJ-class molecular chaperone